MNRHDETTAAVPSDPGRVLEWLREQSSLCTKLDALSVRQRSLVSADDVAPLLALLAKRQKLFAKLASLGARLAPVRREWPAFRDRFSAAQRAEADRLLQEGGRRLREVMERDAQDARVLAGRKEVVARGLKSAHATAHAISAYRTQSAAAGSSRGVIEGA